MSDARSVAELGVPGTMAGDQLASGSRQYRQFERQRAVTELVMSEGSVRIEDVAERFGVSLMTVHRDLDMLESRGILRKTRGVATATSTSVIESSDVYRSNRQAAEKEALAVAAMDYIEPGQAIILDDSTTVMRIARHLDGKAPITVITNVLTVMNALRDTSGITLLGLGGLYYNWCSAFMGPMTRHEIAQFQADTFIMSTSAITNDVVFHQYLETVDTKRAMFDAANKRILLADHELPPGTLGARVVASAGGTLHSCIASALCATSGLDVGRMYERVQGFIGQAKTSTVLVNRARRLLALGQSVPGFDHPLYPKGDPRAVQLLDLARKRSLQTPESAAVLRFIDQMRLESSIFPRQELAVVVLTRAMGLPAQVPAALFALARVAGWVAHVQEQRASGTLLRPRARFVKPD